MIARRDDLTGARKVAAVRGTQLTLADRQQGRSSSPANGRGICHGRHGAKIVVFLKCGHEAIEATCPYLRVRGREARGR